jgi:hypothetical protein
MSLSYVSHVSHISHVSPFSYLSLLFLLSRRMSDPPNRRRVQSHHVPYVLCRVHKFGRFRMTGHDQPLVGRSENRLGKYAD